MRFQAAILVLASVAELVAAHGAIVQVVGDAGGRGSAIGIDPSTPRGGTKRRPFQQDTTRFKGPNKDVCGETLGGGQNEIDSGVRKSMEDNGDMLPQMTPGGTLLLIVHQVNGDGAGPYKCEIDSTGSGKEFRNVDIITNVEGNRGNSKSKKDDHRLEVKIPKNTECNGKIAGKNNVCMGRCMNPAKAGPFGGCFAFQMAGRDGGNNNNNGNRNNNNNNNNDNNDNNNNNNNNNSGNGNGNGNGNNNNGFDNDNNNGGNNNNNNNNGFRNNFQGGNNRRGNIPSPAPPTPSVAPVSPFSLARLGRVGRLGIGSSASASASASPGSAVPNAPPVAGTVVTGAKKQGKPQPTVKDKTLEKEQAEKIKAAAKEDKENMDKHGDLMKDPKFVAQLIEDDEELF